MAILQYGDAGSAELEPHGDEAMSERAKGMAFVLVAIGTLGLLTNEFIFSWGRTATMVFAAANAIGLVSLGIALWGKKDGTPE
jgi:hypothetical protein